LVPNNREELVEEFWGMFDETSAELVKAKRRLRDGTGTAHDVAWHRAILSAIRADLAALGEHAEVTESGE
jgi:hypothetical protein